VKKTFTTLSALLLSSIAVPALAQDARVVTDLNMRAGPGTQYPVVTTIPGGRAVDIHGCEGSLNWCDVSWRGNRGWVYSDYLNYTHDRRTRPVAEWGTRLDLPIVSFSFGDYADRHYRGMPWYSDRGRWDDDHRRGGDRRSDRGDRRDRWDGDHHRDRDDDDRRGRDDRAERGDRGGDRAERRDDDRAERRDRDDDRAGRGDRGDDRTERRDHDRAERRDRDDDRAGRGDRGGDRTERRDHGRAERRDRDDGRAGRGDDLRLEERRNRDGG
jgi:uncharacterized protein YraI